ncbi:protein neprosin-like isoform X2 [Malania oleifera]|uniref:protein neprosin-like isoform X2 n=1 Tax=Malania oleifera TaxID=397392 RepID=UPI0025AE424E|nr:protein neprosin-like isoform X2 [Malania oleifera]
MDLIRVGSPWTKFWNKPCPCYLLHSTRQLQCIQTQPSSAAQQKNHCTNMASSPSHSHTLLIIPFFVAFLLVSSSLTPVLSLPTEPDSGHRQPANQTFRPGSELHRLNKIRAYLKKINKPAVETIKSPDGDLIDCVLSHLQPAFDHPQLKGQKPLDPPERPKGHDSMDNVTESLQLWSSSGEACPEGTVPIRRTTEKDVLRASDIRKFGRKLRRHVRRDTTSSDHEHAVMFVKGDQYYGAKTSINVWAPRVTDEYEFSLSQIWVISGSFENDLNTIEAGWQTDAYQKTGCYNLLCSGFIQTNNKIAIGAAISPRSSYGGRQFDIGLMVWKDPKHGHWWLEFGSGLLVGYWPSFLFSHLRTHASMIQFGGEIVNTRSSGYHTSTQMGSGHFAEEGYGKSSYFRNLQVVDWDNSLIPPANPRLFADRRTCYNIRGGSNNAWGYYFYYGGPGKNSRCL